MTLLYVAMSACGTVSVPVSMASNQSGSTDQLAAKPQPQSGLVTGIARPNTAPTIYKKSASEHISFGVELLKQAKVAQAVIELGEAMKIDPDNKIAADLLQQINMSPSEYFKKKNFFTYKISKGDTLTSISQRFLHDAFKFHMLGKYNGIYNTDNIVVGATIKIPGTTNDEISKLSEQSGELNIQNVYSAATKYYNLDDYQHVINLINKQPSDILKDHRVRDLLVLTYTKYANILAAKAELVEAQTVLENAVNMLPNNKDLKLQLRTIKTKRDIDTYVQNGIKLFSAGKTDKAYQFFVKVLDIDPNHKVARKHVIKIKEKDISKHYKLAMQYYRRQDMQKVISELDRVLNIDPNHELAKLYRARAVELQKRIERL